MIDIAVKQQLSKVLRAVMKNDFATLYFNDPVDPDALGIPQYREVIKNPMDLGTVQKKLTADRYVDLVDFLEDVRLVWENCRHFNCEESEVYAAADDLEDEFQQLWKQAGLHKMVAQMERQQRSRHQPARMPGSPGGQQGHHPLHRCLVALERLLQHPDAKYVSSTAEALRHGWTDLEVYAERPVHLGPIVQELRQGAAVGWSQQGYMSAAQVLRDVETVWANFRTYFGLHPPHPMNAKLRTLQGHWEQVWHEVASQVNFSSIQGNSMGYPPSAHMQRSQLHGGGPAGGVKRRADADPFGGSHEPMKQQRVQQPYTAQIQANTLPYMRQQQLEQQHHHQASLQQPPQPAPQPSPGGGSSKAGGRAYRGSRCEVCLRNKKGKCGTKSASMKCHKRKENGLPYYNEQGKVVKPPGYNSDEEDAAPLGSRQTGRSPRPMSGMQPSPSISRQRSMSGAALAASPTIGSDLPSPTDRTTRRRSASGRSTRVREGAEQQEEQQGDDWAQGVQRAAGASGFGSVKGEDVGEPRGVTKAGASADPDMDEDPLVELKAQYMEQQQALHSRQTRLQQEVEDKDTAAAQLECQIQERRQQQEHFQGLSGAAQQAAHRYHAAHGDHGMPGDMQQAEHTSEPTLASRPAPPGGTTSSTRHPSDQELEHFLMDPPATLLHGLTGSLGAELFAGTDGLGPIATGTIGGHGAHLGAGNESGSLHSTPTSYRATAAAGAQAGFGGWSKEDAAAGGATAAAAKEQPAKVLPGAPVPMLDLDLASSRVVHDGAGAGEVMVEVGKAMLGSGQHVEGKVADSTGRSTGSGT